MPPILFAHRGGQAHAEGNSLSAFAGALERGATALESDVRLTRDGHPVLSHDPVVGVWPGRVAVAEATLAELPSSVPSLAALYGLGTGFELSLDLKDPAAFRATVDVASQFGAAERLWLCAGAADLAGWRPLDPRPHLVHSARIGRIGDVTAHARRLREAGIEALNLPVRDWSAAGVAAAHDGGVLAFGWDAHSPRTVRKLVAWGCDGVYGDDVEILLAAV